MPEKVLQFMKRRTGLTVFMFITTGCIQLHMITVNIFTVYVTVTNIIFNPFMFATVNKHIFCIYQGWEFANSLIAHSLICSFCSNQMSDCERFAQITQDK